MTSCSGLFDFAAVDELKRLAAKYSNSLPQFALRWTLNNPVVGTALVGFRTPAEVIGNLDALVWEVSNADMAEIDVIFDRHGAITLPPSWLED
jgi:aryl-alcohol dehydrogenase-like predicted oxidoreductase